MNDNMYDMISPRQYLLLRRHRRRRNHPAIGKTVTGTSKPKSNILVKASNIFLRNYYSASPDSRNSKRTKKSILRLRSNSDSDDTIDASSKSITHNNKKSVCFATKIAENRETISLEDMTEEEIQNSWLEDRELAKIQKRCRRLVIADLKKDKQQCDDDDNEDEEVDCMWGLEHLQRRKTNIAAGRDEVLITQQSQRSAAAVHVAAEVEVDVDGKEKKKQKNNFKYRDDEAIAIAAAYNTVARECRRLAELTASRDRKEVQSFLAAAGQQQVVAAVPVVAVTAKMA